MAKWGNPENVELKKLYKENNVPSDQLAKDKDSLEDFTNSLNIRFGSSGNFTSKEVADQLFKLRKSGKLPKTRD